MRAGQRVVGDRRQRRADDKCTAAYKEVAALKCTSDAESCSADSKCSGLLKTFYGACEKDEAKMKEVKAGVAKLECDALNKKCGAAYDAVKKNMCHQLKQEACNAESKCYASTKEFMAACKHDASKTKEISSAIDGLKCKVASCVAHKDVFTKYVKECPKNTDKDTCVKGKCNDATCCVWAGGSGDDDNCKTSYDKLEAAKCLANKDTCEKVTTCGKMLATTSKDCAKDDKMTAAIKKSVKALKCSSGPQISKVSPNVGQQDTAVTITGSDLFSGGSGLAEARLGNVVATIVKASSSAIVLRAGALATKTETKVAVLLVSKNGKKLTLDGAFKYTATGIITELSPSNGQLRTRVTLKGTNLLQGGQKFIKVTLGGIAALKFKGTNVAVDFYAGGLVTAKDKVVDVILYADTGAIVVLKQKFVYNPPSPDSCKAAGVYHKDKAMCTFPLDKGASCKGSFSPANPCRAQLLCDKTTSTCAAVEQRAALKKVAKDLQDKELDELEASVKDKSVAKAGPEKLRKLLKDYNAKAKPGSKATAAEKKAALVAKKKLRKAVQAVKTAEVDKGDKVKMQAADVGMNTKLAEKLGDSAEVDVAKATKKTNADSADKAKVCAEADVKHGEDGTMVIEMEEGDISVACKGEAPVSKVTLKKEQEEDLDTYTIQCWDEKSGKWGSGNEKKTDDEYKCGEFSGFIGSDEHESSKTTTTAPATTTAAATTTAPATTTAAATTLADKHSRCGKSTDAGYKACVSKTETLHGELKEFAKLVTEGSPTGDRMTKFFDTVSFKCCVAFTVGSELYAYFHGTSRSNAKQEESQIVHLNPKSSIALAKVCEDDFKANGCRTGL